MGALATFARVIHVLLVAGWLGAGALSLSLEVTVPEVLDSQQAAEAVLAAARHQLDLYGLAAGPVALVTLLAGWAPLQVPLRSRVMATLAATLVALFSGQYLGPQMAEVAAAMGRPLEDLPENAPLVVQYTDLGTVSLGALILEVAAALLLTVTAITASRPRRSIGIEI